MTSRSDLDALLAEAREADATLTPADRAGAAANADWHTRRVTAMFGTEAEQEEYRAALQSDDHARLAAAKDAEHARLTAFLAANPPVFHPRFPAHHPDWQEAESRKYVAHQILRLESGRYAVWHDRKLAYIGDDPLSVDLMYRPPVKVERRAASETRLLTEKPYRAVPGSGTIDLVALGFVKG